MERSSDSHLIREPKLQQDGEQSNSPSSKERQNSIIYRSMHSAYIRIMSILLHFFQHDTFIKSSIRTARDTSFIRRYNFNSSFHY